MANTSKSAKRAQARKNSIDAAQQRAANRRGISLAAYKAGKSHFSTKKSKART